MALLLPRELPSGVTTQYHRILKANFDFNPPPPYRADGVFVLVTLEVGEYLTEEHRRAGRDPVRREVLTIPASEATKSILKDIYAFLGSMPPSTVEVNRDAEEGMSPPPPVPLYGYEGGTAA